MKKVITFILILIPLNAISKDYNMFYPLTKLKKTKHKKKKSINFSYKLKLSAVVVTRNKKIALINGRFLSEGEIVEGCTILKIIPSPPSVVLDCKSSKIQLRLRLVNRKVEENNG